MRAEFSSGRLPWLHAMRGIAALLVLYQHLVPWHTRGWTQDVDIAFAHNLPASIIPSDALSGLRVWDIGAPADGAVALFFLITGFVIPLSLERYRALGFLAGRCWRIFPPYIVALLVSIGIAYGAGMYFHGQPVLFGRARTVANLFLVHDLLRLPGMLLPGWSLLIEVKYYLLMAVLAFLGIRASVSVVGGCVLLLAGVCCLASYLAPWGIFYWSWHYWQQLVGYMALHLLYIQGGSIAYLYYRKQLGLVCFLVSALVFAVIYAGCYHVLALTNWHALSWASIIQATDGLVAYVIFIACLFLGRYLPMNVKLLRWLGDISYPLYLIHMAVSQVLLAMLTRLFGLAWPAVLIAAACSLLGAWALHCWVEAPSHRQGQRLARLFQR